MPIEKATSRLAREYDELSKLYFAQPELTQHFLDQQAAAIVSALEQKKSRIHYQLPDRIILEGGETLDIPPKVRSRTVGKPLKHPSRLEQRTELTKHLNALEQGFNPGLAVCGNLFRYSLAKTIVHHLLPDGPPVQYQLENGDEIPSIPLVTSLPSALVASTDVVAASDPSDPDRDQVQVPYVAEARRFYLPQWVAFGEEDRLLTKSPAEAEACIASLENAVRFLQDATAICPCIVVDETYQRKRAGLLGQLVNQGRALARYHTREIISGIRSRATAGTLNRGFSLSLPYFDDDALSVRIFPVEVIPSGRIMFVPAFVVLAMRRASAQIHDDFRFNHSTRMHLLTQLRNIEDAFKKHLSTQETG
jgi:hypothetical protein